MKIALAADHAAFDLKEKIKDYLIKDGHKVVDLGTHSIDSVDYPFYGERLGKAVIDRENDLDFGIGFCGTGIGIGIAANKVSGVRAALVYDTLTATLAKEHNNANIITLGGRTTSLKKAITIIDAFMKAKFDEQNPRHLRRIKEITTIEREDNHE